MADPGTQEERMLYTIRHVFMPPKLPQEEEPDGAQKDLTLLGWVVDAATQFNERVNAAYSGDKAGTAAWAHTRKMLESAAFLHRHGTVRGNDLTKALSCMQIGDVLPLLIQAQNAGVIFRKITDSDISFEAFEVQIPAAKVTGTVGKLVVQYPANRRETFAADKNHIDPVSNVIEYLAKNEQDDALPHTRKGGSSHKETRDVASPRYITEGLAGILRAATTSITTPIPTTFIHKRINDHVLWKSANLPWRRSPMWLLIRVALQTTLEEFKVPTEMGYKAFMIFFMTLVIEKAPSIRQHAMPSHLLHFMNSKLARRLYKLGDVVEDRNASILQDSIATVQQISSLLETRWEEIKDEYAAKTQWKDFDLKRLEGCDALTFGSSNTYLHQVIGRKSSLEARSPPDCNAITQELISKCRERKAFDPDQLPNDLTGLEPDVALHDFEAWIGCHLPAWKVNSHRSILDCLSISKAIDMYREMALPAYKSKPDFLSVMHLCILELWVALDTIVTQWCPLLLEYSPEIPCDLLDPLLLPYREHLHRLFQVQNYLKARHRGTWQYGSRSVFSDINASSSFANRFFLLPLAQSLRDLRDTILQSWELKRRQKISELDRLNERYQDLIERSEALEHTETEIRDHWGDWISRHVKKRCEKCKLADSAQRLSITPLEETLPRNVHEAQAVIFELKCPKSFSIWRDVTRAIVLSVTKDKDNQESDLRPLDTYNPLQEFFMAAYPGQHVSLASSTKSISQSHYGEPQSIPATRAQIIKGHAGRWELFSIQHNSWIAQTGQSGLQEDLTFSVEGPYASLQKYVSHTSHSPNSIIAALDSCPRGLSPGEYLAFSHLRAGNSIQWLNIARALCAQNLSFSEYSVFALILQAIWQVGPEARSDLAHPLLRDAHQDLADEAFGRELTRELFIVLESMHGNWKQACYLGIVVAIALKLHSFTPLAGIKDLAYGVLEQSRRQAVAWIKQLTHSAANLQDAQEYHLAMTCAVLRWTFDLEVEGAMPFRTREDTVHYIHAGMVGSRIFARPSLHGGLSILVHRDRRLALKLLDHVEKACKRDQSILNDAVKQVWPSYSPSSSWTHVANRGSRWWSTTTAQRAGHTPLIIHLNLLDGILLINGKSSNVLPREIMCHAVYRELFQDQVSLFVYVFLFLTCLQDLDTIRTSSMTGMDYEVSYLGHEVGFMMSNFSFLSIFQIHLRLLKNNLIVRRVAAEGVEEFIPSVKLLGDLPSFFMTGHHFWYREKGNVVEIRPISHTWQCRHVRHWEMKIERKHSGISARMQESTGISPRRLVSPNSIVYQSLSKALRPLETDPLGLFVTLNEDPSKLYAYLPRHDLAFSLDTEGRLECQSAPGFFVQPDRRNLGCLFGLESILCLHQPAVAGDGMKVIIPKGTPSANLSKYGHPTVTVDFRNCGGCYTYDVDRAVGRLVGSRSVESDLFLILLHAFTSSILPDPLTQRTGTEEALTRLKSGSIFSTQTITSALRGHLDQLSGLTPSRSFYPHYLCVMETIEWHPVLSPQSQNSDFRQCVKAILAHWRRGLPFHREEEAVSELPELAGMDHLTARERYRDWTRPLDEHTGSDADVHHQSTDSLQSADSRKRELQAFRFTMLAQESMRGSKLTMRQELLQMVRGWKTVIGDQSWSWKRIHEWVTTSFDSPTATWCSLYELCRNTQWPAPFEAQSALGLLAYMKVDHNFLGGCIAIMRLRTLLPAVPDFEQLDLSAGCEWNSQNIRCIVKDAEKGFSQSDEYKIPKLKEETHKQHHRRRQTAYDLHLETALTQVVEEIQRMWPEIPDVVTLTPRRLLTTSSLHIPIRKKLIQWQENEGFLLFISQVERLLLQESGTEAKLREYRPLSPSFPPIKPFLRRVSLTSVLNTRYVPSIPSRRYHRRDSGHILPAACTKSRALSNLLTCLSSTQLRQDSLPQRYLRNLSQSVDSLEKFIRPELRTCPSREQLDAIFSAASEYYTRSRDAIMEQLAPETTKETLEQLAGMLPPISTHALLRQLSQAHRNELTPEWTSLLAAYAIIVNDMQRAIRMLQHQLYDRQRHLVADFYHQRRWDTEEYLDWLLVEIDGNFSVRENQAEIAMCMMHPDDHGVNNAVMQLNMGEGKSSVIIPAISASLADSQVLCRVVVPRAQTKQQLQILRRTLTDLPGRIIFSLPFNRNVPLDSTFATELMRYLSEMSRIGAVWLCEPEQLLSLKLLGLDKVMRMTTGLECGKSLIRLQLWLEENTRDILDESDDILNVKQQVIYTKLFGLFARFLSSNPSPEDERLYVKRSAHPAGFPLIRILSEKGREELLSFIKHSFEENDWSLPHSLLSHALQYVSQRVPPDGVEELIRSYCSDEDEYVMQTLLILRGLFSSDILLHALKDKRFRVHYGLDLSRTPVAIPFRAKDFPSLRSEFGHPDVTIVLTCLSYYYRGLDDDMIHRSIVQLLKSNTPDLTYEEWLTKCWVEVRQDLRSIRGINMEDQRGLKTHLYPLLRYNKTVIDFYLKEFIFPQYAKEFPQKLCSSGWDLAMDKIPSPNNDLAA
ncbi:hypothetical protein PIIN_07711 [Serendipita indica DSM 11827]|uniref:ubiquitinyl hydrolase 1 n=1 Tax=Serendipita indica (strain DSM 11827) TaxID=1109443 RepID=G4TR11_SERID|nr:hypothetical protein PIIN_07711 [Serendipita indica DSM 11827]